MLWPWCGIFYCMSNGECAISYWVINIQCIVDQQADVNRPFLFERAHRKLLNHHLFWDVGRALDSVWRVLSINVCSFQIQSLVQEIYRIVTPAICWESNQLSPIGYCREIGNARNEIFKYKYFEYNVLRFRKKQQQLICHSAGKETVALLPWIPRDFVYRIYLPTQLSTLLKLLHAVTAECRIRKQSNPCLRFAPHVSYKYNTWTNS